MIFHLCNKILVNTINYYMDCLNFTYCPNGSEVQELRVVLQGLCFHGGRLAGDSLTTVVCSFFRSV